MKPTVHEDTLGDIEHATELLELNMWSRHFRSDWGMAYWECISCSATHYEKRDGTKPNFQHHEGCRLAEGLPRLKAFAATERQLHNENED